MKKIMVLCVDRDGDLEKKAHVAGPIIGREENVKAATQLGLVDAEDSDINSIFRAVGLADSIEKKSVKDGEDIQTTVVTLIGHNEVGVESDIRISRQLDGVLEEVDPDETIFVSDGLEDEEVIPLIREKANLVATERVVVKQDEGLEETYLIITRYLSEIASDPHRARIFLGLPGLALVIFALASIYNAEWWVGPVAILLVLGGYAFIVGFGLDEHLSTLVEYTKAIYINLKQAGSEGRLTFYSYLTSILLGIVAAVMVIYQSLNAEQLTVEFVLQLYTIHAFPFIMTMVILTVFGKMLDDYFMKDVRMWNYLVLGTSLIIFLSVLRHAFNFVISPEENLTGLVFTALIGLIIGSFFVKIAQIGRRANWLQT